MICLLIFLYDGRCWLWHYSNTSSPIWVHTAVNIHGGLNSHRKSFQGGFLAFLRKFLTSLDDHWASLESLSAVSSQPRRSTQPPARNHHGWDVIALPPLWPRSFLDGSSPLTTTTFLPLEVSRFPESELHGPDSESEFCRSRPGVRVAFFRNRLTYRAVSIPLKELQGVWSNPLFRRNRPESESHFSGIGSPIGLCQFL